MSLTDQIRDAGRRVPAAGTFHDVRRSLPAPRPGPVQNLRPLRRQRRRRNQRLRRHQAGSSGAHLKNFFGRMLQIVSIIF